MPFEYSYAVTDFNQSKESILFFINQYKKAVFFDNNNHTKHPYHALECLAACSNSNDIFPINWADSHPDFYICHIDYNYKNKTLGLHSILEDVHNFPTALLWKPCIIFRFENNVWTIISNAPLDINELFEPTKKIEVIDNQELQWIASETKEEYCNTVNQLKNHIVQGDVYEINYCINQHIAAIKINPVATFLALTTKSEAPFSVFYKLDDAFVLCASPERFLTKQHTQLAAQPIKGTHKRDTICDETDMYYKLNLSSSVKERAEHIMIVDLMRNDLSRCCNVGTVRVDELMEVYTFKTVHQLISTISGAVRDNIGFDSIIEATFPMGSMTGAPKKMACQLISKYEKSNRGIYSGSIGYITPEGDFDLNVVIRSLVYNDTSSYLSLHTGGAITHLCEATQEWDECLLKANAIKDCVRL